MGSSESNIIDYGFEDFLEELDKRLGIIQRRLENIMSECDDVILREEIRIVVILVKNLRGEIRESLS